MKIYPYYDTNFTRFGPKGPITVNIIGSGGGLAPPSRYRRQAITYTMVLPLI